MPNIGFKKYSAYKDSGIEWSPQIPENWQARPVKTWFDVQLGKMLQNDSESPLEKKVPYLKALHVTWGQAQTEDLPEMWASQTQIIQYGVKNGDLLVCEGGEVGRSGIVTNPPVDCIIQNALHRVRARNNAHISYLMYVLFAMGGADWFSILCNKATIAHFTREKFVGSKIPLPSFDEQTIISSYLDRKTAQIDALITKKERMIELLKEERTAIINQAVTGKIDVVGAVREPPLQKEIDDLIAKKERMIELFKEERTAIINQAVTGKIDVVGAVREPPLLGKIPKHWGLKRLKYLVKLINEKWAINDNSIRVDLENIESWTGQLIKTDTITATDEEMKQFIPGDVLFNKLQ